MRRRTTAAVIVAVAALLIAGCSAGSPRADGSGIEGYVEPGAGAADRVRTAVDRGADVIGVDGAALSDDGTHLLPTSGDVGELVGVAATAGARTEVLFSNYSSTIGDFSPEGATALLSSSTNRARVVGQLVDLAARLGTDGVQIDLESMRSQDQADLVTFTRALRTAVRERLGDDAEVSLAMMSSTDPAEYRERGYDLAGLAPHLDRTVLMTYDQHGPWSDAGTIGSLPWARKAIRTAIDGGLPADRIDVGVAGYGYAWGPGADAAPIPAARAAHLVGDRAEWSDRTGEWSATLADGRQLHWSDDRSYAARRDLARDLGVHGVAMWSLNLSALPDR
ncbi:glycosyl hydrolase family 18 protein [Curtobacterium sp. APC 4022]|uniref:glycosyl hydrolase family 18 protein n=1 Tax=Curtobacterium sp. APC 4022 TaxID=3035201 RepID=UPI0025B574A5|nr:glycosyl hydrolase family 18 protein [Curtobacterium sp. APC 4022]MDN3477346.1 glycosyl hydrolase family 18 protein [Curtobacterium sp. APC 4022]